MVTQQFFSRAAVASATTTTLRVLDDDELDNTSIVKVKTAANHLCELRTLPLLIKARFIKIGHEEPEHSRRDHVGRDKNSQTN